MDLKPEEISKVIKEQIKHYGKKIEQDETGTVILVGDGIARANGLDKCMANELVEFENGEYEDEFDDEEYEDDDYDEDEKPKRGGFFTVLVIINIILIILLLWLLVGLLVNLGVLPEKLDLGYTWFNQHIFPIF